MIASMNQVEPRTREERAALKDRERIEQLRLRERIGSYHKYVDNVLVNNPDPKSSHFIPDDERFNKDFASHDKMIREQQYKTKMDAIEKKRVEKYERDLKRWEFMDEENERDSKRIQAMNEKYLTGRRNRGGAAYNILSLQYENTVEGQYLKERDDDAKVRALMRSKNLDVRSNCGFNPVNGSDRRNVDVPSHKLYNPPDRLRSVGESIIGSGFAGKPLRKELFMTPSRNQSTPALNYGTSQAVNNFGQANYPYAQAQNQDFNQNMNNNANFQNQNQYQQQQQNIYQPQQQNIQNEYQMQNFQQQPPVHQQSSQIDPYQKPQSNQFLGGYPGQIQQSNNNYNQQQQNTNPNLPIAQQQQALYGGNGHYLYNQPNIQRDQLVAPAYPQQQQQMFNAQFKAGGAGTKFY